MNTESNEETLKEEDTSEPASTQLKSGNSMTRYIKAIHKAGGITAAQADELLEHNEEKDERLKEWGVQGLRSTKPQNTLVEALALVPADKWDADSFYVKCLPKEKNSTRFSSQRKSKLRFEEIPTFVSKLPGGEENYTVEIYEHWPPLFAGTIKADGLGFVKIEQVSGDHFEIESGVNMERGKDGGALIQSATYDFSSAPHFIYENTTNDQQKQVMMGALERLIPMLRKDELDKLKVYAEFIYSPKHGYRFYEVDDHELWTGIGALKKPIFEGA